MSNALLVIENDTVVYKSFMVLTVMRPPASYTHTLLYVHTRTVQRKEKHCVSLPPIKGPFTLKSQVQSFSHITTKQT